MYARVTLLEIDPVRSSPAEAVERYEREVQPALRRLDGYDGALVLNTDEGKGIIISFWESEAEAQAAGAFATEQLERFATLFRAPPGREQYEVAFAELPQRERVART